MPFYTVTLFLEESIHRGAITHLPSEACVVTRVVEAEDYEEALALSSVGEDCRRVEMNLVLGDPLTRGEQS